MRRMNAARGNTSMDSLIYAALVSHRASTAMVPDKVYRCSYKARALILFFMFAERVCND